MTKKQILLINPSNPRYNKRLFPPLSLTTIAAYIPNSYDIKIIDNNLEKLPKQADLVAMSVNTYNAKRAYEISLGYAKSNIPVILGGTHPTIVPHEAIKYANSVVIGDGELIWRNLLCDYESGNLKQFYRSSQFKFKNTKPPRRDLLKKTYFLESIETLRGCPFDCDFCSVTRFHGGKYRFKPLSDIEREFETIKKHSIFIVDDNLIGFGKEAEERAIKLFQLLKEFDLSWMGQASINVADNPKVLQQAKESGCIFLFLGFESINRDVLSSFNKKLNLKKGVSSYKKIIDTIHDYGINIMGSFIIGSDWDNKNSILRLKDFITESNIDIPNITILTPYPGTKVYNKLKSENRLFNDTFWLEEPFPLFTFKPQNISIDDLTEIYDDLIASFNSIDISFKKFFKSFLNSHSIRASMFTIAENIITGRIFKRVIREGIQKNSY